jgi:hypothetical protein
MRALVGASAREPAVISIVGALSLLVVAVGSGHEASVLALLLAVVTTVAVGHRSLFRWDRLIALVVIVVLFVPIGRYRLPASLPFDLELYRVLVAAVLLLWLTSLLIDSRVRLRKTPFDAPLLVIIACVLASELTNPERVSSYGSYVVKTLTFFLSFVLVYYLTATTIRRRESIDFLVKILVLGGALVAALAIYEQRAQYNVFDHLHSIIPLLTFQGELSYLRLGGNLRVFGPSQHPIALGAAMIVVLPLSIYLARTSGRRWWCTTVLLALGALASGSRTAIVMLVVITIVFLFLKPKETKRLWPVLLPAVVVIHVFLPGTIGSFKNSFFPEGGLIAQQSRLAADADPLLAGGRIRQLKPMLAEASERPIFGHGFGTRITGFNTPERNAPILDNQWLGNALEVGFAGVIAWAWLFARATRSLINAARTRTSRTDDDWLFTALAASVTSFAIGMLTYDAFGFTQVYFIFWILLGISAAFLRVSGAWQNSGATASVDVRRL